MSRVKYKVGQKVRFANIIDRGDKDARFVVLEDNGDRLLLQQTNLKNMPLQPTRVVRKDDVMPLGLNKG